ncbi:farnesol dehydrogenase-like [Chrysoperla carnea]|uniref:farnesol dehydrogenase-like n=1 Tax=Chrysoperla carnea TaxID=189513 RepID=UPI001D097A99|nr:farnesol dehydrogenase-like [Chrysoperla carnea]
MERWVGKVAVVTGSSSGIGAGIAKLLVKKGMRVMGLARRLEKLEAIKKEVEDQPGEFHPVKCDIRCEDDIINAFKFVEKNFCGVDVLVNNAGLMATTNGLTDGDTEAWKKVFDTNVMGLCVATREAVRSMKKRQVPGHIIHICSIAAYKIHPGLAPIHNVYPASKFAVRALAETLRYELESLNLKIKVSIICPAYVKTEFLDAAGQDEPEFLKNAPFLVPENLAEAVVYVLGTPPNVDVTEMILEPVAV